MISSSFNPIADPNYATLYAPYYDAVPFGTPTLSETDPAGNAVDPAVAVVVGNTLHANVATISDFDGFNTQRSVTSGSMSTPYPASGPTSRARPARTSWSPTSCSPRGSGCG